MQSYWEIVDRVHRRAQNVVKNFRASEFELLDVLHQCDRHKVFATLGYNSLFTYATQSLGLSEDVAYTYINVARKSLEVPALKSAIAKGEITISKASRLTKVMTKVNQNHWLELARSSSKRELEKRIATENPKTAVVEKMNYVSGDRVSMQVGLSERLMIRLRRAQDVVSQKRRRPVGLEEVLEVICADYLRREDPLEKAERQLAKGKLRNNVSPQTPQRLARADPEANQVTILTRDRRYRPQPGISLCLNIKASVLTGMSRGVAAIKRDTSISIIFGRSIRVAIMRWKTWSCFAGVTTASGMLGNRLQLEAKNKKTPTLTKPGFHQSILFLGPQITNQITSSILGQFVRSRTTDSFVRYQPADRHSSNHSCRSTECRKRTD